MLIRVISLLLFALPCYSQIIIAPSVYSAAAGGGTPYAFVQQAENSLNNAGTTEITCNDLPTPATTGNFLSLVITYDRSGGAPSFTFTNDGSGTLTWTQTFSVHDGVQYGMVKYRCYNVSETGVASITCTFGATVAYPAIYVAEFSGIKTASDPLTGTPAAQVQNTPTTATDATTSGNTTPGAQPALLFGFSQDILGTTPAPVAGTGFTSLTAVWDYEGVINVSARPEHKRLTSTAAVAATFTAQVNERHITGTAAFLEP